MKALITVIIALLVVSPVNADLTKSTDELCVKIKTCSLQEIENQGVPEEMQAAMVGLFDGMCATWMKPYADTIGQAGLENKAKGCIDSVVAESCESLLAQQGKFISPECKEFEEAADAAGVDLTQQ